MGCIEVGFNATARIFPEKWYGTKINAKAVSLDSTEKEFVISTLKDAVSKYPEAVLCQNLQKVYVVKSLNFYGVPYGGTSYRNTVYITDDNENLNCSYDLVENYFHHEFSSILLREHTCLLQKRAWKKINPKKFRYGKGGLYAILTSQSEMNFDPVLNVQGFLTTYSQASLEEDFNVYCQNLFNGKDAFWKIVDTYPKVKAKMLLVVEFYSKLDKKFTEAYFRRLVDGY